MSDFLYAFNSVFPLFIYMALGVIVNRAGWASEETLNQLNSLTFKTFLPIMIFVNILTSDLEHFPGALAVLYPVGAVLITFFLAWFLISRSQCPNTQKGVLIQAVFRSNYVLFGLPLVQALTGGSGSGITEVLIAIIIPVFNILAVISLSLYSEQTVDGKQVFRRILKNPLIIGSVLGIMGKFVHLDLPNFILNPLSALGKIATPLALMILGAQFRFADSKRYFKKLLAAVSLRLLIVPAIFVGGAIVLGMRGEVLITYLPLFGGPVAVSSYTMAHQMGADDTLAGQILVYTSIFCLLTLFLFIFILRKFAFI